MLPVVHHSVYAARIPTQRRFPTSKYLRLIEVLRDEGIASAANTIAPKPVSCATLERAHKFSYVYAVVNQSLDQAAVRRIGFPVTAGLIRRTRHSIGGTISAGELALEHGLACNTAGGSHHAHADFGAGYCVFNDVAVAIRALQAKALIATAWVIDLDVHQGDGTAEIFSDDESVQTFSMHCEANFPAQKKRSDIDLGLPSGTGDEDYLQRLERCLDDLFAKPGPDIVFYNAGVDPHAEDRLGRLQLSDAGLAERDRYVVARCRARGLPVACVVGGGYSDDVDVLARRHAILYRTAAAIAEQEKPEFANRQIIS